MAHPIVLDTDLGMGASSDIDDGFALAMCLADPDIDLRLVTTVNGNTDVHSATLLSRYLIEMLGGPRDLQVVEGARAPLVRVNDGHAPNQAVHEEYARYEEPVTDYAASAIARAVLADPGNVTLVAIGPLTNVAAAFALDPRVEEAVKEVVIMGGSFFEHSNGSGLPGEWNIYVDPEAAKAVLGSTARLRFVGLDVTMRIRLTAPQAMDLYRSGLPFASFAGKASLQWMNVDPDRPHEGWEERSCVLHDPLAVAAAVDDRFVTFQPDFVEVGTDDATRGMTVARSRHRPEQRLNCEIGVDVDAPAFIHYLTSILGGR